MDIKTTPVKGRIIIIADEVGPGAFALDVCSSVHPAKLAVVALGIFKQASAVVNDEMQRREILNQFEEITKTVSGNIPPKAMGEG